MVIFTSHIHRFFFHLSLGNEFFHLSFDWDCCSQFFFYILNRIRKSLANHQSMQNRRPYAKCTNIRLIKGTASKWKENTHKNYGNDNYVFFLSSSPLMSAFLLDFAGLTGILWNKTRLIFSLFPFFVDKFYVYSSFDCDSTVDRTSEIWIEKSKWKKKKKITELMNIVIAGTFS